LGARDQDDAQGAGWRGLHVLPGGGARRLAQEGLHLRPRPRRRAPGVLPFGQGGERGGTEEGGGGQDRKAAHGVMIGPIRIPPQRPPPDPGMLYFFTMRTTLLALTLLALSGPEAVLAQTPGGGAQSPAPGFDVLGRTQETIAAFQASRWEDCA